MDEMPDTLLAGVDGGASKTRAAIISAAGAVLATSTVRSASAYHREPEEASAIVVSAVQEALALAKLSGPVAALGAGLAGADDRAIHERLTRALAESGLAQTVFVDHDAGAALAGGTALAPGVVIISGTGSIAFGVDADGRRVRAGGWGPLLDDEGSGYAVGRAVLRAAMRAFDGRGEATRLVEAVQVRFGLATLAALKIAVRGISIDEIASIAPLAVNAAAAGDPTAARILGRAGERLAGMVAAVARALGWQNTPFPLIRVGGMFEAGEALTAPMTRALLALACPARWQPALFSPEVGAALLGARAAGLDVAALIQRLARDQKQTR